MGPKPTTSWSTPSTRRWRSTPREAVALVLEEAVHELADDPGELAAHPVRVAEVDARRKGVDDRRLQAPLDVLEGLFAAPHGRRRRTLATLDGDDEVGRTTRPGARSVPAGASGATGAPGPFVPARSPRLRCRDTLEQRHAVPPLGVDMTSGPEHTPPPPPATASRADDPLEAVSLRLGTARRP